MKLFLYPRLAAENLKNNRRIYLPYLCASIGTVAMFYGICAISQNPAVVMMPGGAVLLTILALGTIVVGLFSALLLFYTNSFLMKRRQKEFGLYGVLGMEKRHISCILFFENLYTMVLTLVVGLIFGLILQKLLFLLILRILSFEVQMGFEVSLTAVFITLALFFIIFSLVFVNNLRHLYRSDMIELLYGEKTGEREPKTKWLLTLIGILCLGGGYYLAMTRDDPVEAIMMFFVAVLLVIAGTYCLFTAGSIAVLKLLRRKKSYYYKTSHFISVSGLMHRMKRNAAGLANICILSTMVLVVLSSTVSLYIGMHDVLNYTYPKDVMVVADKTHTRGELRQNITQTVQGEGLVMEDTVLYQMLSFGAMQEGDSFILEVDRGGDSDLSRVKNIIVMTLSDYQGITGSSVELSDGEILIYGTKRPYGFKTLGLFGREYEVKEELTSFSGRGGDGIQLVDSYYIIVPDEQTFNQWDAQQKEIYGDVASEIKWYCGFNLKADDTLQSEMVNRLRENLGDTASIQARSDGENMFLSLYGGLFFLGSFLALLFIMAAVLIMYYKQISEGYEDKQRFEILQKVGMSRREVRKTIRSQVLILFFLPLCAAAVHVAFAFKMITQLLALLGLSNLALYGICTVCCILVFALFYVAVYILTARVYYKIVS